MKAGSRHRIHLPKSAKGWCAMAAGGTLVVTAMAAALIGGSVWMEHHYPSDEPDRALFPRAQRWISRPIVVALGREIHSHYRRQSEAKFMETGLNLHETIGYFCDENIPLAARRDHAFRLAREGTPEALAALQKVFATAPPADQEYLLWLIGRAGNPATIPWLASRVHHEEESVARAAIRALGLVGGDDAIHHVADVLADAGGPQALRIEAAVTLGAVQTTSAQLALTDAFARMPTGEVAMEILHGLARYDFDGVAPVFRACLSTPAENSELRIAAVEALAKSSAEAVPFLLEVARADADPEVRAGAAWAVSTHQTADHFGTRLTAMAESEPEPDVRRRLYEAMIPQTDTAAERLLPLVMAENDTAARIAGCNAIGASVSQDRASPSARDFDEKLVPELAQLATQPNTTNLQLRAVFALRRAGTPAAQAALADIHRDAAPLIANAAGHGLQAPP
jgi:HEAT repeat protein